MTVLYDLIFALFAIVYIPYLLLTGRLHKDFAQRFGIFPENVINALKGKDVVWVHAVSVGEMMAVRPLCDELLQKYPSKRLVISTVTKTGNSAAESIFGKQASVIYLPLDFSWIVNKALSAIAPRVFIIVETEIWPNLITSLNRKGVPVIVVNGRISPRSFKKYIKIRFFMKPILEKIALFCMQNNDYAEKIRALGAPSDRVVVTGNMKYDAAVNKSHKTDPSIVKKELGITPDQKVFVAGSTHPGENEIIMEVYKELLGEFKGLRLIIAPRHIERANDIEALAKNMNLSPLRVSAMHHASRIAPASARMVGPANAAAATDKHDAVFILDKMGRLSDFYSIADIVFIGGSLIKRGGQNILEAAVLGKPIVFGPNMFNFSDIANLFLDRKAACMVHDGSELLEVSRGILNSEKAGNAFGKNAKAAVEENLGVSRRNLDLLGGYVC